MPCMCGDPLCPSCGTAQGTYPPKDGIKKLFAYGTFRARFHQGRVEILSLKKQSSLSMNGIKHFVTWLQSLPKA